MQNLNGSHRRRAEKESLVDPSMVKQLMYLDDSDPPVLRWRKSPNGRVPAGTIAGGIHPHSGRRMIAFNGARYYAYRLIFAYHYGRWPLDELDHIDGDPGNDRIENLREVSHAENMKNRKMTGATKTGVLGVQLYKPTGKWRAKIRVGGRCFYLGYFDDFSEAVAARQAAEVYHGFHENHGRRA